MNKKLRCILSLILVFSLVLPCNLTGFAQKTSSDTFMYAISVSERNAIEVKHHMVKRGIPLLEGQVMPEDNFVAVDSATGETLPVYTKALEKYEDGSVSWLLVSFFLDLNANEKRDFTLKRVEKTQFNGSDIKVAESEDSITVSNGLLNITVDKGGLNSIVYKNSNLLSGNGTNAFYSVIGAERINGVGESVEVYENTPNYVTIKAVTAFNGGMSVEQLYTVYRNSGRIGNQQRFILSDGELSGYIFVDSIGQELLLTNDFTSFTNGGVDHFQISADVTLSRGNSVSAYSPEKNATIAIVSRDVNKFSGVAGNLGVANGFVTDKKNKTLTFAPLVYRTGGPANYKWYDGIGRTFHSDIILSDGDNTVNYENEFLNIDNPPYVHVDPQRYVDTGWLGSTETTSVMDRNHNAMIELYNDVRLGRLDTGSLTYESAANGMVKGIAQRPAKIEYHAWYGQWLYDDSDYYDIIAESCETYADICIYRGANSLERGAGRYRNYFDDRMQFENWQCYYTTPDGMYLGYLMTGNEYLKDTIKLHYDYALAVSLIAKDRIANMEQKYGKALLEPGTFEEAKPIEGGFQILGETLYYTPDDKISVISNSAVRFANHARSAYFVYRLFEDTKYLGITKGYIDWLDYYQMPNGRFSSAYDFNGSPRFMDNDTKHIVTSNYIILYGLRAVNDLYRLTDEDDAIYKIVDRAKIRKILVSLSDWFIEDMSPAGELWSMSDPETAAIDGSRGITAGYSYGAEILYTAYQETKDIKYLEAFCRMQRADKAFLEKDGFMGEVHAEPYKLVQMGTFYIPFFRENEELIRDLGYGDLVDIFLYGSDMVDDEFKALNPNTPVTGNIWTNGTEKTIYLGYSNNGADSHYIANINTGDSFIYEGVEQIISTDKNTVLTPSFMPFDQVLGKDLHYAKKTNIKVLPNSSDVKASVIKNTDDEIVLLLQAENGKVNLALENAKGSYSVDAKYQCYRNSKIVTFKKGGNIEPVNGIVNACVDFSDGNIDFALNDVFIDERVEPIKPVLSDEQGFYPAWMPYSPIQSSHILNPTGKTATFTFTAKPLHNLFDTTIAHYSNENNIVAETAFQFAIKFFAGGFIRATNGETVSSVEYIPFENGKEYEFAVQVNTEARTYSAYVTASDGTKYTLAQNYVFKPTSGAATTIDGIAIIGRPDAMVVTKHSLAK